jgi:hypothetical protein
MAGEAAIREMIAAEAINHMVGEADILVRISTLSGRVFTIVADSGTTVWQLKRYMRTAHGIPKRTQVLTVGSDVATSGKTLSDLGSRGVLEMTLVLVRASCRNCRSRRQRLKRCSACDCYYCDVACQRADWRRHKRFDGCGWCEGPASV